MKTLSTTSLVLLFFLVCPNIEAQFFKNLTKRVEQKVENTVIDKTANKAAEKASKSMDKVFEINPFEGGKEKADPNLVANSYDFTWKYSMKMSTEKGDMTFDYYLKPDATYFGFTSATMQNMFTIMDNSNNVTVMFMESKGNNIGMVTSMNVDLDIDQAKDESAKYTFEQLPDKTINGYHCKGVKAYNDDYEMVMYLTNDTEVSFDNIYKTGKTKVPVQLKDYFKPDDKILMIRMDMNNLKNKKESATMECIGLEKVSKTIKKSDYKFM